MTDLARWTATPASAGVCGLGEGPLWDGPRGRVLWVDINAGTVHEGRLDGDEVVPTGAHRFDRTVGAVVCSAAGDLLVAGAQALITVPADGRLAGTDGVAGPVIVPPGSRRRLNDGACDPAGRFLIGSMALDGARGGEILVRLGADRAVTVLDDDLTLSNGLAFSVDGSLLYSVDTGSGIIRVRSYDADTGAVGPRRDWLSIDGTPDGMCADADGNLWVAIWGGGQVRRYTPDGTLTGIIEVPAPHTTSVAFVGDDLDRLLITTATADLSPAQRAEYPDSGRLFIAHVDTIGLPVAPWAGFTSGES